ncbi:hypothetical protein BRY73_16075 [Ochrobactrum sp. P6BS-III]|uniref:hypothetical protein n=1 Tax=unclassified Ochrobactrum TaxID=239106 RepID=UPI0009934821|nr:hypothetical protein [Ochrobactrum sp. P6BSIII]OOL15987.1 hypothetical protein BRY73_16075 [Ochrobactrum sp. P6BS-III]
MKRTFILTFVALNILSAPASANDAQLVADMAAKCWTLPEGTDYQRASATFEVTYNAEGQLTQIVTVEYQPVRRAGEQFAVSAQEALKQCAGETTIKSKTVRVVMRYVAPQPNGPLIMKKPLR